MVSPEQNTNQLNSFEFEGKNQSVSFGETLNVKTGVECDTYTFDEDTSKDLGIIRIKPGNTTPLQKVLKGNRTVEGYISGKGKLTITKPDGTQEIHPVGENPQQPFSAAVEIGDLMQWEAGADSNLVAYEICLPPYEDGRFENLPEN